MESLVDPTGQSPVTIFVDPTCPFAWITAQWLAEVSLHDGLETERRLMSLAAVNEGRTLEPWYREYNDRAWRPARVAAALLASDHRTRWPEFYQRFGYRRHVEKVRDDTANLAATLDELGLPSGLAAAADDTVWDNDLRKRTEAATAGLGTDGGTPLIHLEGTTFFGPVLDSIPRGPAAVSLWEAVRVLAVSRPFAEIKRGRAETLRTT